MLDSINDPLEKTLAAFSFAGVGGNPAVVVVAKQDSNEVVEEARLASKRFGVEATLVVTPGSTDALAKCRYFVPAAEMPMCGHGTLAAISTLQSLGLVNRSAFYLETPAGPVRGMVGVSSGNENIIQILSENNGIALGRKDLAGRRARIASAANIEVNKIYDVFTGGSVRLKTYVVVDRTSLDALHLDSNSVATVCVDHGTTGLYFMSLDHGPGEIEARHFPNGAGLHEDAATGVAAGAIGAYLDSQNTSVDSYTIFQGRRMGRLSRIHVSRSQENHPGSWWVGGTVRAIPFTDFPALP